MQIKWRNEKRKISELNPAVYNPRRLTDKQKEDLAASLERFSLADPIVINKNNTIIGGHQRIVILKERGIAEVDVRVPDALLTKKQEKELNLRLNRNLGEWDFDLLFNFDEELLKDAGFESDELDKIFQVDSEPEDDAVPDNAPAIVKKGDIYQLGRHRFMCGDSTKREDVERLMDGRKADMVFTDPPYGVSYGDKNKFLNTIARGNHIQAPIKNDHQSEKDIMIFWKESFEVIKEILAPINSYYITGPQIQGMMMMMMMMEAGLPYRHVLIWVKNNHVLGRCDYNYKHEPIFMGWTTKHKFYGNGEFQTSVWEIEKPHKSELHPTMKPVRLIVNALQNSSKREDICFDGFLGSGSTLIACEKTNRVCYGMEIDLKYCDVIIKRWEDFTKQKAVKVVGSNAVEPVGCGT